MHKILLQLESGNSILTNGDSNIDDLIQDDPVIDWIICGKDMSKAEIKCEFNRLVGRNAKEMIDATDRPKNNKR